MFSSFLAVNRSDIQVLNNKMVVSGFSRSRPAPLPVQLHNRGSLHVLHQGGRRPEAQEPSRQRHAEERPQTAVDGSAER